MRLIILVVTMLLGSISVFAEPLPDAYNVKDFGAKGDGVTLDSPAVNMAIETCSSAGGGTIYFPPGRYICGSIRLKSNIALYIDMGATIKNAPQDSGAFDIDPPLGFEQYQDFGHSTWRNGLIWGENLENIAVIGLGIIDGEGMQSVVKPGGGGKAIALKLCRNILIKDITILKAGHFGILPTGCDNMKIDNVKVDTNRDGINVDCCKNVTISNCVVNSPDDGICLKSSYALGYARATENVTITNCIISGYVPGSVFSGKFLDEGEFMIPAGNIKRIGRIKFGTESNGGFRNIAISNCVFDKCWGIALETVDGGILENVNVNNITMTEIADAPIFVRLGARMRGPQGTPVGVCRNITISNITATVRGNKFGCILSGIPGHYIENVTLSNINITLPGGGTSDMASAVVPEKETGGPEPTMFGTMPSYGLYCRHIKGLTLRNVRFNLQSEDARPALICEDVDGLEVEGVTALQPTGEESEVVLRDTAFGGARRNSDFKPIKPSSPAKSPGSAKETTDSKPPKPGKIPNRGAKEDWTDH